MTISGAGPTVLVWCPYDATGVVLAALQAECAGWAEVMAWASIVPRSGARPPPPGLQPFAASKRAHTVPEGSSMTQ